MSFIHVSPESHFPIQNLPYGVFSTSDNVSGTVSHEYTYKIANGENPASSQVAKTYYIGKTFNKQGFCEISAHMLLF